MNYAHNKDPFSKYAHDYRCKIYGGILDHLFQLIFQNDESVLYAFNSWVGGFEDEDCQ